MLTRSPTPFLPALTHLYATLLRAIQGLAAQNALVARVLEGVVM